MEFVFAASAAAAAAAAPLAPATAETTTGSMQACVSAEQGYPVSATAVRHFKKRRSTQQDIDVDEDPEVTLAASTAEAISKPAKKRKTHCAKKNEVSVSITPHSVSCHLVVHLVVFRHASFGSAAACIFLSLSLSVSLSLSLVHA